MFADVRPRAPDLCFSQPRMKLGPGNEPSVSRKSHFEYFISFATSIFADLHQASYCAASEKLLLYVRVHRSLGGVPAQPGGVTVSFEDERLSEDIKLWFCWGMWQGPAQWRGCSAPGDRGRCCRGTLAAFPPMQLNYLFSRRPAEVSLFYSHNPDLQCQCLKRITVYIRNLV